MKKNLVVIMFVVFIISCLGVAGCGQKKAANAPSAQSEQKAADSAKSGNELKDLMQSARQVQGMSYEMINTVDLKGQKQVSNSKMWISGKKIRMETEVQGMKTVIIGNGQGDIMMYNPSTNTVMKMSDLQNQDNLATKWAEDDTYLSKMKIVGQEKIDGSNCLVVTLTEDKMESKMWLRKDIGMPARMEAVIEGSTVVIEYKNYQVGKQDDSLFQVPAGAKQIEMPDMSNVSGQ